MADGPTLLILAAGMGSRYGGPKQIDPVGPGGEIILDYSVYDALRAGFADLVFVIRRESEADMRACVDERFGDVRVRYVYQELTGLPEGYTCPDARAKPWGTGHAILSAAKAIDSPFCVINADDFYGRESFRIMGEFLRSPQPGQYAMVGYKLANTLSDHGTVSRGVCDVHGGRLQTVTERTGISAVGSDAQHIDGSGAAQPLSGDAIVSLNLWGFGPDIFAELEGQFREFLDHHLETPKAEFYIPSVVDRLIREQTATVDVLETPESWFGVTYPDDKARVVASIQQLINDGVYPGKLFG
jgi:NDP-sugar pyrophosphorylase family protein